MFKFDLFGLFIQIRWLGVFGIDKFDKSIAGDLGELDTEMLSHLFLHIVGDELSRLSL